MIDPIDKQAAEFAALRAKRLARPLMSSPTNSASPKFIPGAAIAASKAALQARADLAKANRDLAETKTKLATAQAALANAARVSPAKAAPVAPAATTPAGTVTAAEFGTKPLVMTRGEFSTMTPADKTRFAVSGGRVIE